MKLSPYLSFNDECEVAFKFYEQCLDGKIDAMMTYGNSPMAEQTPPEKLDKIMHASITVGDTVMMGSDAPPNYFEKPQGFSVSLVLTDPDEAERVFNALAENGTVQMPIQETFWAARFGMLVDRFGTPLMINCDLAA
ncbi:MAG: VOC family protein [Pseudanabaena sp. LacPavin_0818_WC45_MAG_42_6]|nr:VOC family protein [Pseudanabaena sp. LacPavin_0818_WC45_MAG_42_6]